MYEGIFPKFCMNFHQKNLPATNGLNLQTSSLYFKELSTGRKFERRWTIIALRNLIFYFWSNIELTWHECSFMSQTTNYKEKM